MQVEFEIFQVLMRVDEYQNVKGSQKDQEMGWDLWTTRALGTYWVCLR
jgi:hypothetical protein